LSASDRPRLRRTTTPDLVGDWRRATVGSAGTDKDLQMAIVKERASVEALPDPFTPLANAAPSERAARGERVLWEDTTVFVLVAKPDTPIKALVIPKAPTTFITDAPEETRNKLAQVAAATADAFL